MSDKVMADQKTTQTQNSGARLNRTITQWQLVLYGLGVTVGAGIYVLIGATAEVAGIYAPISFLVAALVVLFTGISYAELAARYPVSAGEAAYVQAGFENTGLALTVGVLVAVSGVVSAAAVAKGASAYFVVFIQLPQSMVTIVLVLVTGAIVMWGIAQSVFVATIITVLEIAGLLMVIAWGGQSALDSGVDLQSLLPPPDMQIWSSIVAASVLAFFAFIGFEDMANVAEEVKDPIHAIPRAIFITLVLATLLYVSVATVVVMSVPMDQLAGAEAPLSLVFQNASPAVVKTFGMIAVIATFNGILIQIIMASRVIFGLANRGQLPSLFAVIFSKTRTPGPAIIVVVFAITIFATLLPIETLAEYTSRIVLVVFVLVNVSLFRLINRGKKLSGVRHILRASAPVFGALTSLFLFAVSFV